MIFNALLIAIREIRRNLTRSFLTVIGIVICVAAVEKRVHEHVVAVEAVEDVLPRAHGIGVADLGRTSLGEGAQQVGQQAVLADVTAADDIAALGVLLLQLRLGDLSAQPSSVSRCGSLKSGITVLSSPANTSPVVPSTETRSPSRRKRPAIRRSRLASSISSATPATSRARPQSAATASPT